ncbi:MAG: hypothetical protein ACLUBL_07355 [Fusobacterium sp.]|uniref:hypothetical protein n=1 Tax=Fusobacterium sp. TaxID=68766 RepID=UPI0039940332
MAIEKTALVLARLESLLTSEIITEWTFGSNELIKYKIEVNGEEFELSTDFECLKDIEDDIQEFIESLN